MHEASDYSKGLESNISKAINGIKIPTDNRSRVSGALFDIVHEHHQAILSLNRNRLFGSAAALVRSTFESYVRGVWFMKCASADDIELFQKDKFKNGSFEERLKDIEKVDKDQHGGFLTLKDNGWAALNSYTHGGFLPVSRRLKDAEFVANYSKEEIIEIERMANMFAVLAVFQIAELGKNTELAKEAEKLAVEFLGNYS